MERLDGARQRLGPALERAEERCCGCVARRPCTLLVAAVIGIVAVWAPFFAIERLRDLQVETDFEAYLRSEEPAYVQYDARQVLWNQYGENTQVLQTGGSRRVLQDARHIESVEVIYFCGEECETIFTEGYLTTIKAFEQRFESTIYVPGQCRESAPGVCEEAESILNQFYVSRDANGLVRFDGNAEELGSIPAGVERMARLGALWFASRDFLGDDRASKVARTRFVFSMESGAAFERLGADVLLPFFEKEMYQEDGLRVLFANPSLNTLEITTVLFGDIKWAALSFGLVLLFLILNSRSVFLSLVMMLSIVLCYPATYVLYRILYGYDVMMIFNFASIFVLVGIGADDFFIFSDLWAQSRALAGFSLADRMRWTFRRAAGSTLATSVTTAVSFLANAASPIEPIRAFGVFMGTVVIFLYIHVLLLLPPALMAHDKYLQALTPACISRGKRPQGGDEPEAIPATAAEVNAMASEATSSHTSADMSSAATDLDDVELEMDQVANTVPEASVTVVHLSKQVSNVSQAAIKRLRSERGKIGATEMAIVNEEIAAQSTVASRFMHNVLAPRLHRFRLPILVLMISLAVAFGTSGLQAVELSDELPEIFSKERTNIGILASLDREHFSSAISLDTDYRAPLVVPACLPGDDGQPLDPTLCGDGATLPPIPDGITLAPNAFGGTLAPTAGDPTPSPTTGTPTLSPTSRPTLAPSVVGDTRRPTAFPTRAPTRSPVPTPEPTRAPVTPAPTRSPVTPRPTTSPVTRRPTASPVTSAPTTSPTITPLLSIPAVLIRDEAALVPFTGQQPDRAVYFAATQGVTQIARDLCSGVNGREPAPGPLNVVLLQADASCSMQVKLDALVSLYGPVIGVVIGVNEAGVDAASASGVVHAISVASSDRPALAAATRVTFGRPLVVSGQVGSGSGNSGRRVLLPERRALQSVRDEVIDELRAAIGDQVLFDTIDDPNNPDFVIIVILNYSDEAAAIVRDALRQIERVNDETVETEDPPAQVNPPTPAPTKSPVTSAPTQSPVVAVDAYWLRSLRVQSTDSGQEFELAPAFTPQVFNYTVYTATVAPKDLNVVGVPRYADSRDLAEMVVDEASVTLWVEGAAPAERYRIKVVYVGEGVCDCHNNGVCVLPSESEAQEGAEPECECFEGFTQESDCAEVDSVITRLDDDEVASVEISWSRDDLGGRSFVDLQETILDLCDRLWNKTRVEALPADLQVRRLTSCVLYDMRTYLRNYGPEAILPGETLSMPFTSQAEMDRAVYQFVSRMRTFERRRAIFDENLRLLSMSITVRTNLDALAGFATVTDNYEAWEDFVATETPGAQQTSLLWARTQTEWAIVQGVMLSTVISLLCAFIAILAFTRLDLLLSAVTIASIISVIMLLLGCMLVLLERKFGAVEAISIIIFIGMSVDYSLHLAHTFVHSCRETFEDRMCQALGQTGPSVLLGAVTTVVAALVLLFTKISLFIDFGTIIAINCFLSITVAIFLLMPALVLASELRERVRAALGRAPRRDLYEERSGATPRRQSRDTVRSYSGDHPPVSTEQLNHAA